MDIICLTSDTFSFFITQKCTLSETYCKSKLAISFRLRIFASNFLLVLSNDFSNQVIVKFYKAFFTYILISRKKFLKTSNTIENFYLIRNTLFVVYITA